MKNRNKIPAIEYFRMAYERVLLYHKMRFVNAFLVGAAFAILMYGLYIILNGVCVWVFADKAFDASIEKIGVMIVESNDLSEEEEKIENEFYHQISEINEITGFGGGYIVNIKDFPLDIINDQNKLLKTSGEGFSGFLINNSEGTRICKFNLKKGRLPDEIVVDKDKDLVYLGSEYSEDYIGRDYGNYVIGGILAPNSIWFNNELLDNSLNEVNNYAVCLDDKAIIIKQVNSIININYFKLCDDCKMEDVANKIKDIAGKKNIAVRVVSGVDFLQEKQTSNISFSKPIIGMGALAFLFVVLSLLIQEIYVFNKSRHEIEILVANGLSDRNLCKLLKYEMLISLIPGFVLACVFFVEYIYVNGVYTGLLQFIQGYTMFVCGISIVMILGVMIISSYIVSGCVMMLANHRQKLFVKVSKWQYMITISITYMLAITVVCIAKTRFL